MHSKVQEGDRPVRTSSATSMQLMLDQTTGRCAMPPSDRTDKGRNLTGRFLASKSNKNQIQGRLTWVWSWSNARKPDARFPPASRPIARAFGAAGVFRAHPLPDLPHRSRLVRTGGVGRRAERPGG